MKKLIFLLLLTALFFGSWIFFKEKPVSKSGEELVKEEQTESNQLNEIKTYTLEEVAQHVEATDCWLAIEGKVYDVTSYIKDQMHPGGAAILNGCGKDATEMFNDRPFDKGPHPETARNFLPNFEIGELSS